MGEIFKYHFMLARKSQDEGWALWYCLQYLFLLWLPLLSLLLLLFVLWGNVSVYVINDAYRLKNVKFIVYANMKNATGNA